MKNDTIKMTKFFFSYMKEKAWLEEKALEGYKLRNISMGIKYEFEKTEPTRLVYEIERFDLSPEPTLGEIQRKEQFLEMASDMGWEVITWDESLTYYLCKPHKENEVNELYNDDESRRNRAARFRAITVDMGRSLLGYTLLLNILMFCLYLLDGCEVDELFTRAYFVFTIVYSVATCSIQFIYKKLGDKIYAELCLSADEWKKKFDDSKNNVKKHKRIFVRSKALVNFLNKQASNGWYLTKANLFSYTFTKEQPFAGKQVYYTIENKSSLKRRLKESGRSLEKNPKDIGFLGYAWMEESANAAITQNLHYVCAFRRNYMFYTTSNPDTAKAFQKKRIFVSWLSYGYVWFLFGCALFGGICGFIAATFAP